MDKSHFRKCKLVFVVSAWNIFVTLSILFGCNGFITCQKKYLDRNQSCSLPRSLSSNCAGRSHSGCTDLLLMCRLWWADICRWQLCSAWVCCVCSNHTADKQWFTLKCSHKAAYLPPGISKAILSPKVTYTWPTNKEKEIAGEKKPLLFPISAGLWFYFCKSCFSFGIYRHTKLSLARSIDLSSNAHLKASQAFPWFFFLHSVTRASSFFFINLLKAFLSLKFPLKHLWREKMLCLTA